MHAVRMMNNIALSHPVVQVCSSLEIANVLLAVCGALIQRYICYPY